MPTYEVTVGDEVYEVESDRDLTDAEAAAYVTGEQPPAEAEPEDDRGLVARYGPTAIRAAAGVGSGLVGAVPSPLTTGGAALLGAGGETAAQLLEKYTGQREALNPASIATEAALSAVPLGKVAKGASLAATAGKEALKIGAVEAVGAQARSIAEKGELASLEDTALAAGLGAAAGGVGGAVAGRAERAVPKTVREAAETTEAAAEAAGRAAGAESRREAVQIGLFDDAGHVRSDVIDDLQPTTTGATATATREMTEAVKAEGREAAGVLSATEAAAGDERLYKQVAEAFDKGDISAPDLLRQLNDNGLSMSEWIHDYYVPSIRRAGRQLQQLSGLRKFLDEVADPATRNLLDDMSRETSSNRVLAFLQKLDDTRRALLVSQLKTGVRNAISQGAAYGTDLVEQAGSQLVGGNGDFFGHLASFSRAMGKTESRTAVKRMLKYRGDLAKKLGEFEYAPSGNFVHDIPVLRATLGRYVDATTWVNRYQEEFFRRAKFDAIVRQGLKGAGVDVAEALANPKLIPDELLEKATDAALELTFASSNPAGLHKLVEGAQLTRPISTFITTFPRYMANAATYVAKRNPLGLVRLATQHGRQNAGKVIAEAATGSMLFGAAVALRSSEHAGEKWYEVKRGERRYDLRGFAGPFAPYLFAADAFKQYMDTGGVNFNGRDYAEGVLSMSRLTGTAATMLSFLTSRMDNKEAWQEFAAKMAGEWVAGFATPAKGIKDALIATGAEEGTLKDTREEPFLGPTKAAIPGLQNTLPRQISLTTGEPIVLDSVGTSALFGLNSRKTNAVEAELNRLNVDQSKLMKATGIPKADRELKRRVGKVISAIGPRLLATEGYRNLPDGQKVLIVKELFKRARQSGAKHLEATKPKLGAALQLKGKLTRDKRQALEEAGVTVGDMIETFSTAEPETEDTLPGD